MSDVARVLERALAGEPAAMRALVGELAPVVEQHVIRGLYRQRGRARQRDVRQEIDDMVQEVFLALLADDARALRAWCPTRGLTLPRFAGLLAERQVGAVLRSGRRSPWTADAEEAAVLDARPADLPAIDARLEAKDLGEAVVDRLLDDLSPRGLQMFEMLFVEERPVDDVVTALGVSSEVVWAWRSRILKRARAIAGDLAPNSGPVRNAGGADKKDRAP